MSSIPNRFNIYGGDTTNHRESLPIEMNHNSRMVRSMFITSDRMNHRDLFSSPPSFSSYQNSHISSSSVGFNNSHMTYHMLKRNYDSVSRADYFSTKDHSHFTQVSFTQTITNKYTTIVPSNIFDTVHYDIGRVKRAIDFRNIWNPKSHLPKKFNRQCEILNPTPLNIVFPHQDSADRQHLDIIFSSSKHNHVFQDGRSLKKISEPTNLFEKSNSYDSQEDEKIDAYQYDGRTHSLPYTKYGPYTCPRCNGVFDTSQKFAAHMLSHYNNETDKERDQRFRARNKKRYRKFMDSLKISKQKI
ncbi:C2H2-type zinc finger protein-like [Arabidopsis thaliana]|uniref:C2H2 and C2HC zinc fingers superfamily protein n=1 Tax=Arabidopsis thaliana TaxID=3702 RepID=Q9FJV4_ARATH|nr:C2H2 and C2HC zinc fingers superfamily protein [Arabidopsis thaliana]AED94841.1 C2H2 and C2HC zinc fingers superfamily protein [Arabidopsis thaliana]BAB10502.1 C2H2-type zinc finger protein-like [Arabidopsis thaliana]|eukprot:NP_199078.1 C2H2 and C2HC zinc fingers superfamily protein [Arabidopsis thaliana]